MGGRMALPCPREMPYSEHSDRRGALSPEIDREGASTRTRAAEGDRSCVAAGSLVEDCQHVPGSLSCSGDLKGLGAVEADNRDRRFGGKVLSGERKARSNAPSVGKSQ